MSETSFDRFLRLMNTMQFETLPLFSKPHFQWLLTTDYVGRRFVYRPESESTMEDARRMLERFRLTNGAVVLAETQTAGRGRAGRSWVSPPDVNLYFTVLLTPEPDQVRPLAYVTPVATARAIEQLGATIGVDFHPQLKWPNDVLIDGKKVGGILIETTTTEAGQLVALIGVGINVNLDVASYPEIAGIATSLMQVAGRPVYREELLGYFCNHFESLYETTISGNDAPFLEWKQRLINLGRPVVANGAIDRIEGTAVDVAPDGALVIELANGQRVSVEAGDVTLTQH